ncbi:MAG: hypothetical protein IV100_09650 [Myxococcales bacterium]|nr:hypothetical protein [Myxococcales bacterium]
MIRRTRLRYTAWLIAVALLVVHQAMIWRELPIDADVFALLPAAEPDAASHVLGHIVEASSRTVWVALEGDDWDALRDATRRFVGALPPELSALEPPVASRLLEVLRPYRDRLVTESDLDALERESNDQLAHRALSRLSTPLGSTGAFSFLEDPLGLATRFLESAASEAGGQLRVRDGLLTRAFEGRQWTLLRLSLGRSALSLDGTSSITDAIGAALRVAGVPGVMAGVPLFAEAAAVEAHSEVSTIGLGSAIAVIVLVVIAFGSIRPLALVLLSLGVGVAAGLSVVVAVFGQVHVLTLVFGASLVGVAEDYGIHAMTSVAHRNDAESPSVTLARILPGLSLALLTSIAAYAALALGGLPGLLQMATFSVVGLTAAFLTVVATVELFSPAALPSGGRLPGERWAARLRPTLPRPLGVLAWGLIASFGIVVVVGFSRLDVRDDLRALTTLSPSLLEQQRRIATLVGLESPAQTVVVTAATESDLVVAEEAAAAALRSAAADGLLTQLRRAHAFCPSEPIQARARRLNQRVHVALAALLEARLGQRVTFAPLSDGVLTRSHLRSAVPELEMLVGGLSSVITLSGLSGPAAVDAVRDRLSGLPGVRLHDRTAILTQLMTDHRATMIVWLAVGHLAVLLLLWWRYRARAWRAYLPTLLGSLAATAALGWLAEPLDLFAVLPLLLLAGMGVDYGIFLAESDTADDDETWMSISVGAASTALSFGLLAFSATPALHRFGIVLLVGITTTWLTAPLLRPSRRPVLTESRESLR